MNRNENTLIERRLARAKAEKRPALIPFVTAGFPTEPAFWEAVEDLDAHGADIIEIGVPFSDPVADGPVVEAAGVRALEQGMTLRAILKGLNARKKLLNAAVVLMGYANPFLRYAYSVTPDTRFKPRAAFAAALDRLATDCASAGAHGFIIPDLPLDEAGAWSAAFEARGLRLIPLVGQNTSEERMKEYARRGKGYVYVVSVLGTTGVREGMPPELEATLKRARACFSLPLALGFGLKSPDQLAAFKGKDHAPDAVIFGSALLKHIEAGNRASEFLRPWQQAALKDAERS